jgi:excisionase family DNA binding protein
VFGLPEIEAAASVGISQTKFRELVAAGTMPSPRIVGGKLVYDVDELQAAFKNMPHRGNEAEEDTWSDLRPKAASGD